MNGSPELAHAKAMITHEVDFASCYVTQRGRGVAVIKKGETEPDKVLAPPQSWGDSWAWNVLEDGSGIYFRQA